MTENENAIDTIVGFHRLHGYGDGKVYDVWVFRYDLAGISLILFAFTGIYLGTSQKGKATWMIYLQSYRGHYAVSYACPLTAR